MKLILKSFLVFSLLFLSRGLQAQTNESHAALVKGNCEMCKERIETTAKAAGAATAQWDLATQKLALEFDPTTTSIKSIFSQIAKVGHDNAYFTAEDAVYNNLPSCCLYDRSPSILEKSAHTHSNEFFVRGNCESCQLRIESTAKKAGATAAQWSPLTQKLVLEFDKSKTTSEAILKEIAKVGHDNELFTAEDKVYKNLPDCCLYDRELPLGEVSERVHFDASGGVASSKSSSGETSLETVSLVKSKAPTALDRKSAGLVFNIGEKELLKAACCNLAESFETNATVDVSYSNAVTGTKQLKMLGLDQKYTALTKELLPEIRGLATAYGLNFIPGRWIGGIQLTKGGSTVTSGYESITGQINTELVKYGTENETSLNLFADQNARTEMNLVHTSSLNEHWNQSILLHGNGTFGKEDHNDDGFLDQPTGNQLNMAYLLNYNDLDHSGWGTHFGINMLRDSRYAGQTSFDKHKAASDQSAYGVGIDIARIQLWNKTGHIFEGKPYQSIGLMNQYTYHQQDSFFGLRNYLGSQQSFYSNLVFESIFGNTNHKYKTGVSFLYDKYDETYLTQGYERTETVPGLFFEYTVTGLKYTLVAGARADFHNLAGTQFTPRLNFRYDLAPNSVLRLSAGRGFRTANVFAESQGYLASNREIEILKSREDLYGLDPEIAWNYGVSFNQQFKLLGRNAALLVDFFRTDFQNQVILDLDQSTHKILFYNLEGDSYANSFQTQLDLSPVRNFDIRMAYKYYDVQTQYLSGKRQAPFMAKHRGFLNLAYATTKNEKGALWSFDTTLNYVGKQRLPNTEMNPAEFRLAANSDSYTTLNAQIAREFSPKLRVYLGGENLTSYTQDQAIIDAQNPFGNYFDGGMISAPIMPANLYLGIDVKF